METIVKTLTNTYPVRTGRGLFEDIKKHLPPSFLGRRIMIITDDNVAKFYLKKILSQLENCKYFIVPHGETSKTVENAEKIANELAENNFTRKDCILALGGGVIGDLSGFVASIYMRGIPYAQLPTTLLAGIDSSVGGKTAVNLNYGKNLIGRIYPPEAVIFDINTLLTLPEEYVKDGIGEGLKYAILEGGNLFELMEIGLNDNNMEKFVDSCIRCKKRIVESDENETSVRRLLNLGHTVGHAIERKSELTLTHGICVSMGLRVVCRACRRAGYLPVNAYERILELLNKYSVPENPYPISELIESIRVDKKTDGAWINFITVHNLGDCRITPIVITKLEEFLK